MRQNRLAQLVGIHESLLSKIINGFREPEPRIKARIASALETDENWLFVSTPRVTNGTPSTAAGGANGNPPRAVGAGKRSRKAIPFSPSSDGAAGIARENDSPR